MADDIRQETLLATVEGVGGYRGEVPLFGWLCGIARHKVADELRRCGSSGLTRQPSRCGPVGVPARPVGRAVGPASGRLAKSPAPLSCRRARAQLAALEEPREAAAERLEVRLKLVAGEEWEIRAAPH